MIYVFGFQTYFTGGFLYEDSHCCCFIDVTIVRAFLVLHVIPPHVYFSAKIRSGRLVSSNLMPVPFSLKARHMILSITILSLIYTYIFFIFTHIYIYIYIYPSTSTEILAFLKNGRKNLTFAFSARITPAYLMHIHLIHTSHYLLITLYSH